MRIRASRSRPWYFEASNVEDFDLVCVGMALGEVARLAGEVWAGDIIANRAAVGQKSERACADNARSVDDRGAILEPVRNEPRLCFEWVTAISVCRAEPVRNGKDCWFFTVEMSPQARKVWCCRI